MKMNKKRRRQIEKIRELLTDCREELNDVISEEEECLENIPESLQGSERYGESEEFLDLMNDALSNIESAVDSLEEIS